MTDAGSAGLLQRLSRDRLMVIVRATDPDAALASLLVLAEAGVGMAEVSLTTPGALDVLAQARARLDGSIALGAGTVITEEDARRAVAAGATFLVTPGLTPGAAVAATLGVEVLAGALTPSEVVAARELGAPAIKLFPAAVLGPGYLRALRDPFPNAAFVPVGGVGAGNVAEYLEAGALAVGVGSSLIGDAADPGGDLDELRQRARALKDVVDRCN